MNHNVLPRLWPAVLTQYGSAGGTHGGTFSRRFMAPMRILSWRSKLPMNLLSQSGAERGGFSTAFHESARHGWFNVRIVIWRVLCPRERENLRPHSTYSHRGLVSLKTAAASNQKSKSPPARTSGSLRLIMNRSLTAFLLCTLALTTYADEGMWLFNQPPRQLLHE